MSSICSWWGEAERRSSHRHYSPPIVDPPRKLQANSIHKMGLGRAHGHNINIRIDSLDLSSYGMNTDGFIHVQLHGVHEVGDGASSTVRHYRQLSIGEQRKRKSLRLRSVVQNILQLQNFKEPRRRPICRTDQMHDDLFAFYLSGRRRIVSQSIRSFKLPLYTTLNSPACLMVSGAAA